MTHVTVVLCTWNGSELLRDTLEHIGKCRVPDGLQWELIVVDNNSTEDIQAVVGEFEGQLPIRYILEPKQGLSHARNAGIDAAQGELMIFTDNDVRPSEEWIAAYWKAFQERPEGYYFGGSIRSRFEEGVKLPPELLEIASGSVKGLDLGKDGPAEKTFFSANWACTSEMVRKVGKFNPDFGISGDLQKSGEEDDVQMKLKKEGLKPWVVEAAWLWHYVPKRVGSLKYIKQRWYSYGYFLGQNEVSADYKGRQLFGVPLYIIRKNIQITFVYALSRLTGNINYKLLEKLLVLRGRFQAYRDFYQSNRNKASSKANH